MLGTKKKWADRLKNVRSAPVSGGKGGGGEIKDNSSPEGCRRRSFLVDYKIISVKRGKEKRGQGILQKTPKK